MDIRERAELAQRAARAAGELISARRDFQVSNKSDKDYVTEMDVKSEKLIRETLLSACPEDGFYGEESGGTRSEEGRWIVDPIDGTTNYIRGIYCHTISIAYEANGQLVLGVVYCPPLDEMYVGIRGQGATLNGKRLALRPLERIGDAVIGMSFAHRNPDNRARTLAVLPEVLQQVNDLRRMGSAAYDLCSVAAGRYDGFFELGLYIYDIAAGMVIVEEAGGVCGGWDPAENVLETGNIIAGGPEVFDFLRRTLNGAGRA